MSSALMPMTRNQNPDGGNGGGGVGAAVVGVGGMLHETKGDDDLTTLIRFSQQAAVAATSTSLNGRSTSSGTSTSAANTANTNTVNNLLSQKKGEKASVGHTTQVLLNFPLPSTYSSPMVGSSPKNQRALLSQSTTSIPSIQRVSLSPKNDEGPTGGSSSPNSNNAKRALGPSLAGVIDPSLVEAVAAVGDLEGTSPLSPRSPSILPGSHVATSASALTTLGVTGSGRATTLNIGVGRQATAPSVGTTAVATSVRGGSSFSMGSRAHSPTVSPVLSTSSSPRSVSSDFMDVHQMSISATSARNNGRRRGASTISPLHVEADHATKGDKTGTRRTSRRRSTARSSDNEYDYANENESPRDDTKDLHLMDEHEDSYDNDDSEDDDLNIDDIAEYDVDGDAGDGMDDDEEDGFGGRNLTIDEDNDDNAMDDDDHGATDDEDDITDTPQRNPKAITKGRRGRPPKARSPTPGNPTTVSTTSTNATSKSSGTRGRGAGRGASGSTSASLSASPSSSELTGINGSEDRERGRWTPEEDALLRQAVREFDGKNWKKIAATAFGTAKSDVQCLHRWQKVLRPGLVKGPWTEEEDQTVREMVAKYGLKRWSQIADHLNGRLGKQCRERWFNHLDPKINKESFTEEEDEIIIRVHAEVGNKWAKIASRLQGRTDNQIKNRWHSALARKAEQLAAGGSLSSISSTSSNGSVGGASTYNANNTVSGTVAGSGRGRKRAQPTSKHAPAAAPASVSASVANSSSTKETSKQSLPSAVAAAAAASAAAAAAAVAAATASANAISSSVVARTSRSVGKASIQIPKNNANVITQAQTSRASPRFGNKSTYGSLSPTAGSSSTYAFPYVNHVSQNNSNTENAAFSYFNAPGQNASLHTGKIASPTAAHAAAVAAVAAASAASAASASSTVGQHSGTHISSPQFSSRAVLLGLGGQGRGGNAPNLSPTIPGAVNHSAVNANGGAHSPPIGSPGLSNSPTSLSGGALAQGNLPPNSLVFSNNTVRAANAGNQSVTGGSASNSPPHQAIATNNAQVSSNGNSSTRFFILRSASLALSPNAPGRQAVEQNMMNTQSLTRARSAVSDTNVSALISSLIQRPTGTVGPTAPTLIRSNSLSGTSSGSAQVSPQGTGPSADLIAATTASVKNSGLATLGSRLISKTVGNINLSLPSNADDTSSLGTSTASPRNGNVGVADASDALQSPQSTALHASYAALSPNLSLGQGITTNSVNNFAASAAMAPLNGTSSSVLSMPRNVRVGSSMQVASQSSGIQQPQQVQTTQQAQQSQQQHSSNHANTASTVAYMFRPSPRSARHPSISAATEGVESQGHSALSAEQVDAGSTGSSSSNRNAGKNSSLINVAGFFGGKQVTASTSIAPTSSVASNVGPSVFGSSNDASLGENLTQQVKRLNARATPSHISSQGSQLGLTPMWGMRNSTPLGANATNVHGLGSSSSVLNNISTIQALRSSTYAAANMSGSLMTPAAASAIGSNSNSGLNSSRTNLFSEDTVIPSGPTGLGAILGVSSSSTVGAIDNAEKSVVTSDSNVEASRATHSGEGAYGSSNTDRSVANAPASLLSLSESGLGRKRTREDGEPM